MHYDEKLNIHLIFLKKNSIILQQLNFAGVMELADVPDSKSGGSDTVPVRPRSPAPEIELTRMCEFYFFMFNDNKGVEPSRRSQTY